MKKQKTYLLTLLLAISLVAVGCGQSKSPDSSSVNNWDNANLVTKTFTITGFT